MPAQTSTPTLAQEFVEMHLHMARVGRWKTLDIQPRRVRWGLWKAWGPCGFKRGKYEQVKKHYVEPDDLARCIDRMLRHAGDKEWNSLALPMGVGFDHRPRSPLRYRDGQCVCGLVLRMDCINKVIYPQATWRLVEITRRFLVDCAVMDYVFDKVLLAFNDTWTLGEVELNFNVMWLADYHAPLAEKWMPGLSLEGPPNRVPYFRVRGDTKFKSRQIGNDLAKAAKPMFDVKRRRLLPGYEGDDFPKG